MRPFSLLMPPVVVAEQLLPPLELRLLRVVFPVRRAGLPPVASRRILPRLIRLVRRVARALTLVATPHRLVDDRRPRRLGLLTVEAARPPPARRVA